MVHGSWFCSLFGSWFCSWFSACFGAWFGSWFGSWFMVHSNILIWKGLLLWTVERGCLRLTNFPWYPKFFLSLTPGDLKAREDQRINHNSIHNKNIFISTEQCNGNVWISRSEIFNRDCQWPIYLLTFFLRLSLLRISGLDQQINKNTKKQDRKSTRSPKSVPPHLSQKILPKWLRRAWNGF